MESKNEDSDIITRRSMPTLEEILRNKKPAAYASIQDSGEKEFVSKIVEKISRGNDQDFSKEVPSFNLGKQILSQQRKIAGLKRKSPSPNDAGNTPPSPSIKLPSIQSIQPPASPQQQIISEIIAREIQILTSVR
ncbi:MAG: hypothetical protein ABR969_05935 [Sedimentisphaerales bacterium]|jgi:hypothetical protein